MRLVLHAESLSSILNTHGFMVPLLPPLFSGERGEEGVENGVATRMEETCLFPSDPSPRSPQKGALDCGSALDAAAAAALSAPAQEVGGRPRTVPATNLVFPFFCPPPLFLESTFTKVRRRFPPSLLFLFLACGHEMEKFFCSSAAKIIQ